MSVNNKFVFVTSCSPKNIDRTQECINSWKKYGSEIYAVQLEEEAENIKKTYHGVNVISTPNTGSLIWSKKTPNILELINLTKYSDAIIINSDIEITYSLEDFDREVSLPSEKTFLCGIRYNKNSSTSILLRPSWWEPYGIDLFRIPKASLDLFKDLNEIPFAIGMPGWDFWLPYFLYLKGLELKNIKMTTNLSHEYHSKSWDKEDLILTNILFKRFLNIGIKEVTKWIQKMTGREGWDFNMAYSKNASIIENKQNSFKKDMTLTPMLMSWPPATRKTAKKLRKTLK
jgi:hypothetical protein